MVTKEQLTIQYRDVMVFENLGLKQKLKDIFKKTLGLNDDASDSDTDVKKVTKVDEESSKNQSKSRLRANSNSNMSAKSGNLAKMIEEQKKLEKMERKLLGT